MSTRARSCQRRILDKYSVMGKAIERVHVMPESNTLSYTPLTVSMVLAGIEIIVEIFVLFQRIWSLWDSRERLTKTNLQFRNWCIKVMATFIFKMPHRSRL